MRYYLIIILVALGMSGMNAQQKTYKETKSLTKELECKAGDLLSITGQRTFITIKTWDKPSIKATIEVSSKYSDQAQAQVDLEKIDLVFTKKKNEIIYSNAMVIKSAADKPKSSLRVDLELMVPEFIKINSTNDFGKINLEGNITRIESYSKFTGVTVNNCNGDLWINSKYGDLSIVDATGDIDIESDKSNVTLKDVSGPIKAQIKYGEVDLFYNGVKDNYKIFTQYSPIKLHIPAELERMIDLSCYQCQIQTHDGIQLIHESMDDNKHKGTIQSKGSSSKAAMITSDLEDIHIFLNNFQAKSN